MKITLSGANREVTGSCYYIEADNGSKIVLDCGIFQGGKYAEDKNREPFPFDPNQVQAVVVTHAHFDHVGRIPKLYQEGFRGNIYATEPTCELAMITLRDAVHLMKDEAERHEHDPLYEEQDVEAIAPLWKPVEYHTNCEVAPGITIYLADAGHILGSATIKVMADGQEVVFSGDLGNSPVPLLVSPEGQNSADIVFIESTYGNRLHEPASKRTEILANAINEAVKRNGVLLIPAFAMERTQELLFEINQLQEDHKIPVITVFLDTPMGIAATKVFEKNTDFFNPEAQREAATDDLFHFKGLTYTLTSEESKSILHSPTPKVIIAGSGMMNGGRILHHLKNYLEDPSTLLMIIGYQVEGSLGRRLHNKERQIKIFGQDINVQASVKSFGSFSGHADYPRLMNWLNLFQAKPPRKIFVTHGELNSALSFSESIEEQLGIASGVPQYGEVIDVGLIGLLKN